uniref:Uncharacterized protein n=1 Tax=Candidatus Kentrum sp. FW TaxID=2126338 RepID=A0A450TKZ1_9GAMM|nr:MAG: hypothetical protein BECKFW1821C_GA0114237_101411 [Candidatus Kentron sp. FW]
MGGNGGPGSAVGGNGGPQFESGTYRVLVRDLREVWRRLIEYGLDAEYAHSLIDRTLFICYL